MNELQAKVDYKLQAKNYLQAKNINLDENELQQFILISQAYGLNPFKNEIYAVKYSSQTYNQASRQWSYKTNFSVVVSYQVILSVATRHNDYGGVEIEYYSGNKPVLRFTQDTPDLWAIIKIYKYVNGNRLLNNTSRIDYANDYKQQRNNTFAKNYFTAWCEKLAYVSIIRKTYPTETQGMYLADEFATNIQEQEPSKAATTNYDLAVQALEQIQDVETRNSIMRKFLQENKIGISNFKKGEFDMEKLNEAIKAELVDIDTMKEELE